VLSRRAANLLIASGVSALMIGAAGKELHRGPVLDPPRTGPTGALDDATLSILMNSAQALIGREALDGPYEGYYQHQALHRPGYLDIYKAFAAAVRRRAADFAELSLEDRLAVLDRVSALSRGRYDGPILQETLGVFMKSDAWVLLGYNGWPGSPRGIESYQTPTKAGSSA